MSTNAQALPFQPPEDDAQATAFAWAGHVRKTYAVHISMRDYFGKQRANHTSYARARTPAGAIAAVKRNLGSVLPKNAEYSARLASPRELGCVWVGGEQ